MPRALSLLAAVALLVGGCAATARPAARAATDAFPPTDQVKSLSLPFDAYSPSLAALYTLSNAQDRLTRDCMKAAGLDWKVIARPTTVNDYRNRRRYGVIEMAIAQDYGFHVPTGLLTPAAVEQLYDARENSLSQQQKDAAYGKDGCATRATQRFPANSRTDQLSQFDRKSLNDSRHEPSVAAALKVWRECAGQQNLHYQDPLEAASDTRWWADESAGPSAEEKKAAVVDVQCKEKAGLVNAWHTAEARIQEEIIRRNTDYFQRTKTELESQLADANAILSR
jgi:hypothetical protein